MVSWEPDMSDFRDHIVTSIEALERIYGEPYGPSIAKETDSITTHYRAFIEAAPFFALATTGPELCASFAVNEKAPRAVLIVSVDRIFYQCAKAIVRSKLWDPSRHVER